MSNPTTTMIWEMTEMDWSDDILEKLSVGECSSLEDQVNASFEIKRLRRALNKIAGSGTWMHRTLLADIAVEALRGKDFE